MQSSDEVCPAFDDSALSALDEALERILKTEFAPPRLQAVKSGLWEFTLAMRRFGYKREEPTREILARLGDKWSVLLLLILARSDFRFAVLQRLICVISDEEKISQRILTVTLRTLERDGLVSRTVHGTVPPRVDYAITPRGRSLLNLVSQIIDWASENCNAIIDSQHAFDNDERNGRYSVTPTH